MIQQTLETAKIRHQAEISRLKGKIGELEALRDELESQWQAEKKDREGTIARQFAQSQAELEGEIARLNRELGEQTKRHQAESRKLLQQQSEQYQAEIAALEEKIGEMEAEIEEWKQRRADIDHDLAAIQEWRIEQARNEGFIRQLESDRLSFESRIAQLEQASQAKISEMSELIRQESETAFAQGFKEAEARHAPELERLALERDRWRLRAERREQQEELQKALQSVAGAIGGDLKPLLLAGEPGAGKGTTVLALLSEAYSCEAGVIPIAYDPSEGGDEDSTWSLGGVPSFSDPRLCLELLRALAANMDSHAMRTNPEKYNRTPAIVFVCDELQTALMGLSRDEKQEFIECFTRLHTAGHKRKVFLFVCNQSHQIQNMKCGSTQLLNGGQLGNFHRLYFNKILDKFLEERRDSIVATDVLRSYLDFYQDCYRLAMVKSSGGSPTLTPIKHPSHHEQKLGINKPSRPIPKPKLAAPPPWFPAEIKAIYAKFAPAPVAVADGGGEVWRGGGEAVADGDGGGELPPPKPLRHLKVVDSVAVAERGVSAADTGFSDDEVEALRRAILSGLNQAASIKSAFGLSKNGKNPKWQAARALYNELKKQIKG
jgi:hypothetical protein